MSFDGVYYCILHEVLSRLTRLDFVLRTLWVCLHLIDSPSLSHFIVVALFAICLLEGRCFSLFQGCNIFQCCLAGAWWYIGPRMQPSPFKTTRWTCL